VIRIPVVGSSGLQVSAPAGAKRADAGTRAAAPAPPAARRRPSAVSAAGALALQRAAGNRAVATLARSSARTLARCAGGTCTCGGRCHEQEELLEGDLRPRRA
jgi:hypothetical protein